MRTTLNAPAVGAIALALILAGCETFDDTYLIEQDVVVDEQGVRVTADLEEDFFGSRTRQFRAFNSNDFDVCVGVSLHDGAQTSGYSFPGTVRVGAVESADVGYVLLPASFRVNVAVSKPSASGECY